MFKAFGSSPSVQNLRVALLGDAVFEFAVAALLLVLRRSLADWLDVDKTVVVTAGVVFVIAGFGLLVLAARPRRQNALNLAIVNVGLGLAGWLILMAGWGRFDAEGRWVLGAICDGAILIGIGEWMAVRRFDRAARDR